MSALREQTQFFPYGTINSLLAQDIPAGAASSSLNWMSEGSRISLRLGTLLFGTIQTTALPITGLGVGEMINGTQVMFRTRSRKIEYYDTVTADWIEIGTNTLPSAASTDDFSFAPYKSLSGGAIYLSSPNSSVYKIMIANPASITDLVQTEFRGYIVIIGNAMFLWNRQGITGVSDKNVLHRSYKDHVQASDYTAVSAEAIGSSGSLTYTGTLAFKAGNAKNTCFGVVFTDGVEKIIDTGNGTLTGTLGGTGTINYTTGVYSITFNAVTAGSVTCTYYHDNATSTSIVDFSFSATRTATQAIFLVQNEGGDIKNVISWGGSIYVPHKNLTYRVTDSADDLSFTSLPMYGKTGIPNWRAAIGTTRGIYYVDDDQIDPQFKIGHFANTQQFTFESISKAWKLADTMAGIDLRDYRFDKCAVIEYGDLVLFAARHSESTINNCIFVLNQKQHSVDKLDIRASCFAIYNGLLYAGDSGTENVYQIFTGYDDEDTNFSNFWIGNITRHFISQRRRTYPLNSMKRTHLLEIEGEIQRNQILDIYLSYDRGSFILIGTQNGTDLNIDFSSPVYIGGSTSGTGEIGGGAPEVIEVVGAGYYKKQIKINSPKYMEVQIKFVARAVGFVSVKKYSFVDIRQKDQRMPIKYRFNALAS